jgi:hypothetical protein
MQNAPLPGRSLVGDWLGASPFSVADLAQFVRERFRKFYLFLYDKLDAYIAKQPDEPSRAEAIRRLHDDALPKPKVKR